MSHYELDAKRLLCPMPVIRTQDRIKTLQPGDTLSVYCTDPGANSDIPMWARIHGHKIVESKEIEDGIVITIEVGTID